MKTQLQALALWHTSLVSSVRSDLPDLTARQMAMVLSVYLTGEPCTVRGLAQELNISKPAVSRALDRLGELGYIRRERDDLDRRNVLVQRTQAGAEFLNSFSKMILAAAAQVATIPENREPVYLLDAMAAATASLGADGEEGSDPSWSATAAA